MERCARHGRETRVRCSSCGDPICPRCMVDTAVGMKCPSCAAPPPGVGRALRRGTVRSVAAGSASGVVVGLVFGLLRFPYLRGFIGGLLVAEAVLRAGGGRRGGVHLAAGLAGVGVSQVVFWWTLAGRPFLGAGIVTDLALIIGLAIAYIRLR